MSYISFIVFVIEMVLITCYFLGFLFHLTLYACIFILDFVLLKILKNMANKMHFKLIVEVSKFDRCFKFTACKKKQNFVAKGNRKQIWKHKESKVKRVCWDLTRIFKIKIPIATSRVKYLVRKTLHFLMDSSNFFYLLTYKRWP